MTEEGKEALERIPLGIRSARQGSLKGTFFAFKAAGTEGRGASSPPQSEEFACECARDSRAQSSGQRAKQRGAGFVRPAHEDPVESSAPLLSLRREVARH